MDAGGADAMSVQATIAYYASDEGLVDLVQDGWAEDLDEASDDDVDDA